MRDMNPGIRSRKIGGVVDRFGENVAFFFGRQMQWLKKK